MIDWASVAAANEDLLWDGIHLKPAAAGLYARLVNEAVHEKVAFPPSPRPRSRRRKHAKPTHKRGSEGETKDQSEGEGGGASETAAAAPPASPQ